MKSNLKVIAVIGARSGSKSIQDKNIQPILGKPVLGWTVESALGAKMVDRVIVSTDSPEYAEVAKKYGAEVPFLRPKEISQDTSHDIEYLTHAIEWLAENENYLPDIIFKVSASSPLFSPQSYDECVGVIQGDETLDAVYAIYPADKHPYKMWSIKGNKLELFIPKDVTGLQEQYNMPRQILPEAYVHGSNFCLRYDTIMEKKSTGGDNIGFIRIPHEEGFDIDSLVDLHTAGQLIKLK